MKQTHSLADLLDVPDPRTDAQSATDVKTSPTVDSLLDITDPTEFCQKILETREFRQYILNGIVLGDLPAAIVTRVIDHAWGKPPERVEHTGKDGAPIATITEVRRVIVRPGDRDAVSEKMNDIDRNMSRASNSRPH